MILPSYHLQYFYDFILYFNDSFGIWGKPKSTFLSNKDANNCIYMCILYI